MNRSTMQSMFNLYYRAHILGVELNVLDIFNPLREREVWTSVDVFDLALTISINREHLCQWKHDTETICLISITEHIY